MSSKTDILVLGATGFTGSRIVRYLCQHRQRHAFKFAAGARSLERLKRVFEKLHIHDDDICTVQADVTKQSELEAVVSNTRVVINAIGPFWLWGTPVVEACTKLGVHYVDVTGETVWIRKIICEYDYIANKTAAIIVPSCSYDSIPADVCAYLANKVLKSLPTPLDLGSSTTSHHVKLNISGGTLDSMLTALDTIPRRERREAMTNYVISPVLGRKPPRRLLYKVPVPGNPSLIGAFFYMQPMNKAIVQRTFGLLEMEARRLDSSDAAEANLERYGPDFVYDEFLAMPTMLAAVSYTLMLVTTFILLGMRPIRRLAKKFMHKPGEGPSEEEMRKGFMVATNIASSTSERPVYVKTVMKAEGDPGYILTPIMVAESALCILFPEGSDKVSPGEARANLPPLARRGGGILTPMTAFGGVLIKRLKDTGEFHISSSVIDGGFKEK